MGYAIITISGGPYLFTIWKIREGIEMILTNHQLETSKQVIDKIKVKDKREVRELPFIALEYLYHKNIPYECIKITTTEFSGSSDIDLEYENY